MITEDLILREGKITTSEKERSAAGFPAVAPVCGAAVAVLREVNGDV